MENEFLELIIEEINKKGHSGVIETIKGENILTINYRVDKKKGIFPLGMIFRDGGEGFIFNDNSFKEKLKSDLTRELNKFQLKEYPEAHDHIKEIINQYLGG